MTTQISKRSPRTSDNLLHDDLMFDEGHTHYIDTVRKRKGWNMAWFSHITSITKKQLDGMDTCVRRIHRAIESGEMITIITDFDMDGVSSGTLIYAGLAELGANVRIVVPDYKGPREMTPQEVDQALDFYPETSLIITCDGGINSNGAINHAQDTRGVDVMVTDHHVELDPGCNANYIINPNRINSTYPHPDICGAQVAYLLLEAYTLTHARNKMHDIKRLELFAGIGTLTDVMPLIHWSRKLVRSSISLMKLAVPNVPAGKWGNFDEYKATNTPIDTATLLQVIHTGDHAPQYVAAFEGIAYMMRGLIEKKKLTSIENINASFIGFTVGPMFNATRRVGGDMRDTFAIFTPDAVAQQYPQYNINIPEAVLAVIANNERRKAMTTLAMSQIHDDAQPFAPIVFFCQAPAGILGLIASKVMRETNMPAVVLNPTTLRGSARAPEWFNVIDEAQSLNLPGLGAVGHQQACGFHATNHNQLKVFAEHAEHVAKLIPEEDRQPPKAHLHLCDTLPTSHTAVPKQVYQDVLAHTDGVIADPNDLIELHKQLQLMAPFGHGFEYPVINITAVTKMCKLETMGSQKQHIKITTNSGIVLLWWNAADKHESLAASEMFTATVELGVNEFMGKVYAQGIVGDIELFESIEDANQQHTSTL
jgi:single-stranded-DNA-specific exonuclease